MPSALATSRSSGVVMKPWIRSADAPGYTVVTLMTVFDSLGYCRIGSTIAARRPISRISRLTRLHPTTKPQACLTEMRPEGIGRWAVRATRASKSRSTMSLKAQPAARIRHAPMAKPTNSQRS